MPRRGLAPRACLIVELDAGGLIVHFQHILIALHRVDPPQLNVLALKLNGETHFHAGVSPAHIGGAALHLAGRFRFTNALNVGFGLRFNLVVLAPNAKFLICEPSHRVFFPLFVPEKRVGTLRHITTVGVKASIPEIEERDKFPPHIFSFLSNITSPRSTDGIKGGK